MGVGALAAGMSAVSLESHVFLGWLQQEVCLAKSSTWILMQMIPATRKAGSN